MQIITNDINPTSIQIEIHPFANKREECSSWPLITVSKRHDWRSPMRWEPATINWAAPGAQSREQAQWFVDAMHVAIAEMEELDKKYPPGSEVEST